MLNHHFKLLQQIGLGFVSVFLLISAAAAAPIQLTDIAVQPEANNKVRVDFIFSQPLSTRPRHFSTKKPARIVLDFDGAINRTKFNDRGTPVDLGMVRDIKVIEAGSRTRVLLDLKNSVSYTGQRRGNRYSISVAGGQFRAARPTRTQRFSQDAASSSAHRITDLDFRASKQEGGKLIVDVSDANMGVDVETRGNTIVLDFVGTRVPAALQRRLDVTDFQTPVQEIETRAVGEDTQIAIKVRGDYEQFAYQIDKQFIVAVKPISAAEKAKRRAKQPVYSGKRISLNFQDIKVRSVLQLLAEFTGSNIVVSDTVDGSITLRLKNVPWDQALDIILKTRGLAKRDLGSVMLIAPSKEIAAREREALEAHKEVEALAPLRSELIQVNYAKAGELTSLLKSKENNLLSDRGNVSVDVRTNTLWVQDTADKLEEIRSLVHKLDVQVKQVLIEARVVIVNKDFERDIGVRFGVSKPESLSGSLEGANELAQGVAPAEVPIADRLNLNLPAVSDIANPATIGLAVANLGDGILLDLELSALESEGRGEVISSPRLITANQQAALIESGEEIPFQESTSSGATSVAFKKAVLSLQVTPHITPDNKIILDLKVNQDSRGPQTFNNVPVILTKEIQTNVLVDNGQTIVLGGIYRQNKFDTVSRVPFLGSLPLIGALFRNTSVSDQREELLIFVTPKIIESSVFSTVG